MLPEPDIGDAVMADMTSLVSQETHEDEVVINSVSKPSSSLISELPDRVKFFALTTNPPPSASGSTMFCDACGIQLKKSSYFIRCADCSAPVIDLCVHCFANGAEFGLHMRDHAYTVVYARTSQVLRQSKPVSKVDIRGLLRFMEISEAKGSFNFAELENALSLQAGDGERLYLEVIAMLSACDELRGISESSTEEISPPDVESSLGGGPSNFNVLRDEFEHEYVAEAETLLAAVSVNSKDDELQALFEAYNGILDERERRRKVLKGANLTNLKEYYSALKKRKSDEREMFEKLRMFVRPILSHGGSAAQSPFGFLEILSTSLTQRKRFIDRAKRLAVLKENGIRSEFGEATQFDTDRKKRAEVVSRQTSSVPGKVWTSIPAFLLGNPGDKRETMTGEQALRLLPGGEFISSEKAIELCLNLYLAPQHFLVIQSGIRSVLTNRQDSTDELLASLIPDGVFGTIRRYLLGAQGLSVSAYSATQSVTIAEMKLLLIDFFRHSIEGT